MKKYLVQLICLNLLFSLFTMSANATKNADTTISSSKDIISNSLKWTQEEIDAANTAANITQLTNVEKETILYINLARLYPKKFAKAEVEKYNGDEKYGDFVKNSSYKTSLLHTLNKMESTNAMVFNDSAYENAKCFAKESGENGIVGHKRINCANGNFAECCSYGMDNGLEIALQWLIDDKTPSLGHRINCLNPIYTKIGVSVHTHTIYNICAVADMIW